MKNKDKKEKTIYCNLEYFMKHGCRGCKLGRKCEEWDSRIKRDSNSVNVNYSNNIREEMIGWQEVKR